MDKNIVIASGPFSGGPWGAAEQDIFYLAKLLVELGNKVWLITYNNKYYKTKEKFSKNFEDAGVKVVIFDQGNDVSHFFSGWLRNFFFWLDPATHPFFKMASGSDFKKFFEKIDPDALIGIQTFTSPLFNFAKKRGVKTILRSHAVEFSYFFDTIRWKQFLNPLSYIKSFGKYMLEKHTVKNASRIFAINPNEEAIYKKWNEKTKLLPLCSLYSKLRSPDNLAKNRVLNLFYAGGSYNVLFHLKGAEFLIKKVMPILLKESPGDFVLHVFGSKMPKSLSVLCDGKNIIYRSYVPDYDAALDEMDIGVFPVFKGGGMKQKIFEPICRGFPVVVPKIALRGYPLTNQKNAIVANNVDEFVEGLKKLKDKDFYQKISDGACLYAKENFSKDFYLSFFKENI